MSKESEIKREFDLTPSPRILAMLGEINLHQWRCIAELIDNSVDAFLEDNIIKITNREIHVSIPTNNRKDARISVRDNGPGMSADVLESAVKAGWTSHDPMGNLGLFGMGFNIATARIGTKTQVFSTRKGDKEWTGLEIDFNTLIHQKHFRTPLINKPKTDPIEHGTEVTIINLKQDQRTWFSKSYNRIKIITEIGRAYSSMLRDNGVPISFTLTINQQKVLGREHCVWSKDRFSVTQKYDKVFAIQEIDVSLNPRNFCIKCWQWLGNDQDICLTCETNEHIKKRNRGVYGWIGLQRYLNTTDYGIDFLRYGRKIEIGNKDLFNWDNDGITDVEYPIDDPRNRGRFVGEIHIDHCRVTYMKDRFDRNDPAWEEMVTIVRGEGPLRPKIAKDLGFSENYAPLAKLFNTYRRSSPERKVAGGYSKILIVSDNNLAMEMAKRFYRHERNYLSDEKWYELVEEEDRKLLTEEVGRETSLSSQDGIDPLIENDHEISEGSTRIEEPLREKISSLSQTYSEKESGFEWNVIAYSVEESDPELESSKAPWVLKKRPDGMWRFYINLNHSIFRSITMTQIDALLAELSYVGFDFLRSHGQGITFSNLLSSLREKYNQINTLDTITLHAKSKEIFSIIARALKKNMESIDSVNLYESLSSNDQQTIQRNMALKAIHEPSLEIKSGRFIEFSTPEAIIILFEKTPELFFDGNVWDEKYSTIQYETLEYTDIARKQIVRFYSGLLHDLSWLSKSDPNELEYVSRNRILRASLSLDILTTTLTHLEE